VCRNGRGQRRLLKRIPVGFQNNEVPTTVTRVYRPHQNYGQNRAIGLAEVGE